MKKIKSNNDLDVSYVGGVLEILVDGVSVYNASGCFTDGIWKDASKFDRKIRKAVKELMAVEPEAPKLEETKPDIVIPEAIEFSEEDLEDIEIIEETPILRGPVVDKFVEEIEKKKDEKKKPSFSYEWKPKK